MVHATVRLAEILAVILILLAFKMFAAAPVAAAVAAPAGGSAAGDLADQVHAAGDGWVRMSFDARPGVCSDGSSVTIHHNPETGDHEVNDCDDGAVWVTLKIADGEVARLKMRVRARVPASWREDRDLGHVPAQAAADYLLAVAHTAEDDVAEDALQAAVLADGVVIWPDLVAIARDDRHSQDVREAAIFWLGQAAGDKVTAELVAIVADEDEDLQLREHAVFALSQALGDDCVTTLSQVALDNPHPQLRRSALFWLAQQDAPEVVDLFERILLE